MSDAIANRDNLSPLDLRHGRASGFGNLVRSLADQFEIPSRRIVIESAGDKALLVESFGVKQHLVCELSHVFDVELP